MTMSLLPYKFGEHILVWHGVIVFYQSHVNMIYIYDIIQNFQIKCNWFKALSLLAAWV